MEPLLESEISNLLGSIKIRASDIKATLQKHKTKILTTDDKKEPDIYQVYEEPNDLDTSVIEIKQNLNTTVIYNVRQKNED